MDVKTPISEVFNGDCMEYMAGLPDGYFDLVIADPPYKINAGAKKQYHASALTVYKPKTWDNQILPHGFFAEVFRVSKNQIVWGGNYFELPPMPKWIVWDKMQPEGIDQAMHELAWTSFANKQAMAYRQSAASNSNKVSNNKQLARQCIRIHPTQKPIALYKWLLKNYAKPGQKIFDPMMGSQSSRIAAWDMGFDFYGCELDGDYFRQGCERFEKHIAKPALFAPEQMYQFEQQKLFE